MEAGLKAKQLLQHVGKKGKDIVHVMHKGGGVSMNMHLSTLSTLRYYARVMSTEDFLAL